VTTISSSIKPWALIWLAPVANMTARAKGLGLFLKIFIMGFSRLLLSFVVVNRNSH